MLGAHGFRLSEEVGGHKRRSILAFASASTDQRWRFGWVLNERDPTTSGSRLNRRNDKIDLPTLIILSVDLPILSFEPKFSFLYKFMNWINERIFYIRRF